MLQKPSIYWISKTRLFSQCTAFHSGYANDKHLEISVITASSYDKKKRIKTSHGYLCDEHSLCDKDLLCEDYLLCDDWTEQHFEPNSPCGQWCVFVFLFMSTTKARQITAEAAICHTSLHARPHTHKSFPNRVSLNPIWIVIALFILIWQQAGLRLVPDQSEKRKYNSKFGLI